MAKPDPSVIGPDEIEHTGCPTACLVLSGLAFAVALALWLLVDPHRLGRDAQEVLEVLPLYPGILFAAVLALHLGVLGPVTSRVDRERQARRCAAVLGGRMRRIPDALEVTGAARGRRVRLVLPQRDARDQTARIEVAARTKLTLRAYNRHLERAVDGTETRPPGELFAFRGVSPDTPAWRALVAERDVAWRTLFRRGARSVALTPDGLTLELPAGFLSGTRLFGRVVEALVELALASEAYAAPSAPPQHDLQLDARPVPRTAPAWCPYCRGDLDATQPEGDCAMCATHLHVECFEEHGGCPILGCGSSELRAPPDRPRERA